MALTRAEKQAYLTYTQSRYRWGKLVDAEPSRFIGEIDDRFLDYMVPQDDYKYKPLIDTDIFGEVDKSKFRQTKPSNGTPPPSHKPSEEQRRKLRRLRPATTEAPEKADANPVRLEAGDLVEHMRFGKGKVVRIEGIGQDKKAEIDFENGGLKNLLLRFAKLRVL